MTSPLWVSQTRIERWSSNSPPLAGLRFNSVSGFCAPSVVLCVWIERQRHFPGVSLQFVRRSQSRYFSPGSNVSDPDSGTRITPFWPSIHKSSPAEFRPLDACALTGFIAVSHLQNSLDEEPSENRICLRLHHQHLLKLADHNVLEYDARSETVRYRGGTRLEAILALAASYERT